jgi:regulator of protease activity HflC (stomatin/prohibitin superfamily)
VILLASLFGFIALMTAIRVVPQSEVYVIERFGKYTRTLTAGLNFILPILDLVSFKVSILERQLDAFSISVITKDNVEVVLKTTVFYRVLDAAKSVYRIRDVDRALKTAAESIVRSAGGRLELDELQSSRELMTQEIAKNLQEAAELWGLEITRTEITDIQVDEQTREAQRQQLNAERERRAIVARADGERRSIELKADATLYEAKKAADAVRATADADAYATKVRAEAEAAQTNMIAAAISNNGKAAVDFEIMKRQVDAIAHLAGSNNTKTLILPTDITKVIGSISALIDSTGIRND